MERILIVRLGAMGDILHALPAVAALHHAQPQTKIQWLVERRWRDLLPDWVEPIEVDTQMWRSNLLAPGTRHALAALHGQTSVQSAIDLQGSTKSAFLAKWLRAGFAVGPAAPREWPARFAYDAMIETRSAHVIEQAWEIVNAAVDVEIPRPGRKSFDPFPHAAEVRGSTEKIAILNPGAGWPAKQWPAERYGELAQQLKRNGFTVLLNAGPREERLAKRVAELGGELEIISFPLPALIGLLRRAALFVGGDTGPMHLAAMLGVPSVAIFGPTDPARNGPYYERTAVVRHPRSRTSYSHGDVIDPGLQAITVDEVMTAVEQVLR